MEKARSYVSGAALGGYIYACGGEDETGKACGSVEKYDVKENVWMEGVAMLCERAEHRVIACGTVSVFVCGCV